MLRYDRQTKPGLVALYDIRPGNGASPFLQPRSPHGAEITLSEYASGYLKRTLLRALPVSTALPVKVKKVKVHTLDIASLQVNHHRRSAQVWRVFSRDFTVLPAHPHVRPQSE